MKLKELLQHFTITLQGIYDAEEVAAVFYLLTEQISGWNRMDARLKGNTELSEGEMQDYARALKTLQSSMPFQYMLGETVFYGLPFKVNPAVLIPRPETEELVAWVLESTAFAAATAAPLRVLDVGTGSGCIAISIKKEAPTFEVFALDVSEVAIETAKTNAAINEVAINFIEGDIRKFTVPHAFDVIVSNPPYITLKEQAEMHQNVLAHEPHLALFVTDEQPLEFYEAIADLARVSLSDMGWLFFEINASFGKEIVEMLEAKSFSNIILKKDMQGKDRMISCRLVPAF